MGKFELRSIYYPKASYLNYILEIWVDGVNISQFYEDYKLRIDVGYIFHIYNYFDNYLEDIMKEEVLPYEDVERKTIFETIDNIKEKYFYWLKDDYEDDESDEEIEQIINISEPFYEWQRAHRLLLSGPFLCIPDIIFRRIGDKIEISWDTTWDITYQQRKYENENIKFISTKGVSYIDADEFYLEIKKFLKKIDDISKIQNEKFRVVEETGKLVYSKDPYNNIEFKEEKEFLQDLEKIDYKFFTIYELVLITEKDKKDKKVVPIVLKYLSKIEDENIKTHLAYFLAVKNYKEASEKLIKELYNAKTNEYRIALSKALSTIYNKDVLSELLEIAKNKEYKDVNFPIISTLNKYKNKRVKIFFEKNRME